MYFGAELRASYERVQALKAQVDSQNDELVTLRDKVVHLRQCIMDSEAGLQVSAKHDMATATTMRRAIMFATTPTAIDLWRVPSALRNSVDDGMMEV